MKEEHRIPTERRDGGVVLLLLMQQMDLPGILDRHLPRHWGWTARMWLAHIVSQGESIAQ